MNIALSTEIGKLFSMLFLVVLHVDVFNNVERNVNVSLPHWWSLKQETVIDETIDKAVHYSLEMPELQHVIQSYKLYVEPFNCVNQAHHATASLIVPWAHHDSHTFFTAMQKDPLDIQLYSSRPKNVTSSPVVMLTLDPTCRYRISIRSSILGTLGQMVRMYSPLLVANVVAIILLSLHSQLNNLHEAGSCSLFFTALKEGAKPYYILTVVMLYPRLLYLEGFLNVKLIPDWQILIDENTDLLLLPILLYMCSIGIVWMVAVGLAASLVLCESTVHKLASKFLARTMTGTVSISGYLMSGLQKLPCVVAGLLVLLCFSTCGGLALCLGTVFYFLKLTQMSQDYIEEIVFDMIKRIGTRLKQIFFKRKTEQENTKESSSQNVSKDDDEQEIKPVGNDESTEIRTEENTKVEEQQSTSGEDASENVPNGKGGDMVKDGASDVSGSEEENFEEGDGDANRDVKTDEDRETDVKEVKNDLSTCSSIFFHFTIFLLWCAVTLINVPYVLTWAHNFKYDTALRPDPSFLPSVILCVCAVPLWQLELPKINKRWYSKISKIVFIFAAVSLIYAPVSLYRLVYFVTAVIFMVTLHQLLAPMDVQCGVINSGEISDNVHNLMQERVKSKWE